MRYTVQKTYGHSLGLSACFRQWRANSHCNKLHGYALSFTFTFSAETLNNENWVIDFGNLGALKDWLFAMFDHKTLVANDDPAIDTFLLMKRHYISDVQVVENVGCEAFAKMAFIRAQQFLDEHYPQTAHTRKLRIEAVQVKEHDGNSATYFGNWT